MDEEAVTVASSDTLSKPLFRDITADDYDPEITEIESLCMACEKQVPVPKNFESIDTFN